MQLTLAVLLLASTTWASTDPDGSVRSLLAAVREALRAGKADTEVARIIEVSRLAERLDDAVAEQLQSEGAGPQALEALRLAADSFPQNGAAGCATAFV